ncbi:MAG: 7TM diverse intracellular signaling domain-containing protein [Bacteroidota bacterium]
MDSLPATESNYNVYWVRYRLKNQMNHPAKIALDAYGEENDFFVFDEAGNSSHYFTGSLVAWQKKDGLKFNNYIPIIIEPAGEVTIYNRVHNRAPGVPKEFQVDIGITEKIIQRDYVQHVETGSAIFKAGELGDSFLVGILFISLLFNLFFFFVVKEKEYLYYSLLLSGLAADRLINIVSITALYSNPIIEEDGFHLWSERYDRDIDDIFAIQDEIAMAITEKLKVTLLENDRELIGKIHTQNADAHSFYLKGRYEWNKRTQEGFLKSIDYFNQAIAEDQQYSLAYAGMADSYTLLCGYHILSPAASIPTAKYAAEKAMELNPMLAEAYEAVGHIELLSGFDWKKAEDNYSRAIELNPGFATARQRYALMLAIQGRFDEAFEAIMKAQELDPLSKIINTDVALVHLLMGNTGKCIEKCRQVLATDAAFPWHFLYRASGINKAGRQNLLSPTFSGA